MIKFFVVVGVIGHWTSHSVRGKIEAKIAFCLFLHSGGQIEKAYLEEEWLKSGI